MQVLVNAPQGTLVFARLQSSDRATVADLKARVAARCGAAAEDFRLSSGGKPLEDGALLSECVAAGSTVDVNFRLLGGAKKRKKKTYTTPKKIKHKKRKVKLAVLKYYKVADDGKITRLRRECPNTACGAGLFMAAHFDRQYCGKCHLTYALANTGVKA